jgi:triosephosphate isomerase
MRKPILAGNWKMNKTRDEVIQFTLAVTNRLPLNVECIVCAPAIYLRDLVKRSPDNLHIGAQNMHELDSGAYTGEISPIMLKDTGVEYVILGHSERREYFNETDAKINAKIKKALEVGLKPIICVGEKLETREAGKTNELLESQIVKAFEGVNIDNTENVIIAYEPIWAIGTGKSADSKTAEEACGFIRSVLSKIYSENVANEIRILYGGSVKETNIAEYMAQKDVDGALVGGASLKPESFIELCNKSA